MACCAEQYDLRQGGRRLGGWSALPAGSAVSPSLPPFPPSFLSLPPFPLTPPSHSRFPNSVMVGHRADLAASLCYGGSSEQRETDVEHGCHLPSTVDLRGNDAMTSHQLHSKLCALGGSCRAGTPCSAACPCAPCPPPCTRVRAAACCLSCSHSLALGVCTRSRCVSLAVPIGLSRSPRRLRRRWARCGACFCCRRCHVSCYYEPVGRVGSWGVLTQRTSQAIPYALYLLAAVGRRRKGVALA